MERTPNCLAKRRRVNAALRHEELDRVPITDFFWSSFLDRWREDLGLPADASPYRYYDLDLIVTVPNMDPHIKPFEVIKETDEEIIVRTGFEALIQRKHDYPMPAFLDFETNTLEAMRDFEFDDPWDERRYFAGGDNQLAGVGDTLIRDLPPWIETVRSLHPDIPVYGSVCEGQELMWRIVGSENVMLWLGLYPDEVARFLDRVQAFVVGLAEAQIEAADGLLDGMVIWGDVAYRKDLFFSPATWRRMFKPIVQSLTDVCHAAGLPVMYHGCGNARRIFDDFIDIGIDAYNPLEAKAGLDVVDLRRGYGHDIFAFCGNMDAIEWAHRTPEDLKPIVLRKLNAAHGGGFIFASDHSVPSNVSGQNYDAVVKLVREYGSYPLDLGEYELPEL